MKAGIDLRQSHDRSVAVGAGGNDITGESLPAQFTAQRHAHFKFYKYIRKANTSVVLVCVRVRIVN
jgi:hypothetical protein